MPYKEKTCPTCNTPHKKRGPYCSRSCGNHRVHSDEHKQHLSNKMKEHMNGSSDNAEKQRWIVSELARYNRHAKQDPSMREKTLEDYNIIPERPLEGGSFVEGGDIWDPVE